MTPDGHGTRRRHKHGPDEHGNPGKGCCCTPCREASNAYDRHRHRLIAYGRWQPRADAAGTRRRIQALTWNGWSLTRLAARLGWSRQGLQDKMRSAHVSAASAAKVRTLYRELWNQVPPEGAPADRRAAAMARRYARGHRWAPPAAWDDDPGPHCIDDPAAVPAPGWFQSPVAAAIRDARERAGLSQYGLAAKLRVTRSAVQMYEDARCTPSDGVWIQLELTLGPLGVVREASGAPGEEAADAAA